MSKCSVCGAETELFVGGVPLCPACDQKVHSETELRKELASERFFEAYAAGDHHYGAF